MDSSSGLSFDSPYGAPPEEETPQQKIQYFFEDHGKKIVLLVVLLIIGFFVYDFFAGSYRTVRFLVTDTEGNPVDADISLHKTGQADAVYNGPVSTQSLKTGNYSIEASATGYRNFVGEALIEEENQTVSIELEKALATRLAQIEFPPELYAGQEKIATITLQNSGTRSETIEFGFKGDFEKILDEGATILATPESIAIAGGQTVAVPVTISVPGSFSLKNSREGDSFKGKIFVKFTLHSKDVSFKILPEPELSLSPSKITKTVDAGTTSFSLGKISVKNSGKTSLQNIELSIQTDPGLAPGTSAWFTFDTAQIAKLGAGETKEIQLYISPPLSPTTTVISGQSHVVVQAEGFSQTIPLQITVNGIQTNVSAVLSQRTELDIPKNGEAYETITGKNVRITNNGDIAISQLDIVNF